MNNKLLKAALWYREKKGFSVIPIGRNKGCAIRKEDGGWELYQQQKPTPEIIKQWWTGKYRGCNVGIVTGKISNLTVIDVDNKDGKGTGFKAIEEITPDSLITPTAQSPSGGEHRYFLYEKGVRNRTQFIADCDVRSEGGYIIAPPSKNGRGSYTWKQSLSIADVPLTLLPTSYLDALNNSNRYILNNNTKNNLNTDIDNSLYTIDNRENSNKPQQSQQTATLAFSKGRRDETLFHLAHYLVRGGMPAGEIQEYLLFMARHCDPPFPEKDIYLKIQSAIRRADVAEKGLTQALREIIAQHSGNITVTNAQQWATNRNIPEERKKIRAIMCRLEKEGLIKRTGRRAGEYRIVDNTHEVQDWKHADMADVKMVLPLGMHEAVRIVPGSIIMFAGVTNTGKTAFGMNIARLNCSKGTVRYLTSEIEKDEFRARVEAYVKHHQENIDKWDVELIAKFTPEALPDIINPDGLNIIDYLEPPQGDFTQIGPLITEIHHVLKSGITVINIQKKEGDVYGAGGQFIKNKAHLFCTLDVVDYPVSKLKITKCKAPKYGYKNPVGEHVEYKISIKDGLTIVPYGKFNFTRWDIGGDDYAEE